MVFGLFFLVFAFERRGETQLFRVSQQWLNRGLGFADTVLLLTSSLWVALAMRSFKEGEARRARRWTLGAIACGLCFILLKGIEYWQKLAQGITLNTNDFFVCYFVFTGLHLLHVILGVGVLVYIRAAVTSALPTPAHTLIEGGSVFWHLVDVIWVFLFALLYVAN